VTMAARAKKRQKSDVIWGTVDSSGWPKDFWEQMDKSDLENVRKRKDPMYSSHLSQKRIKAIPEHLLTLELPEEIRKNDPDIQRANHTIA
jgi:hypothetical protein